MGADCAAEARSQAGQDMLGAFSEQVALFFFSFSQAEEMLRKLMAVVEEFDQLQADLGLCGAARLLAAQVEPKAQPKKEEKDAKLPQAPLGESGRQKACAVPGQSRR